MSEQTDCGVTTRCILFAQHGGSTLSGVLTTIFGDRLILFDVALIIIIITAALRG